MVKKGSCSKERHWSSANLNLQSRPLIDGTKLLGYYDNDDGDYVVDDDDDVTI